VIAAQRTLAQPREHRYELTRVEVGASHE